MATPIGYTNWLVQWNSPRSAHFTILLLSLNNYYRRYKEIPPISFNECSLLAPMKERCKALNKKGVAAGTYNH